MLQGSRTSTYLGGAALETLDSPYGPKKREVHLTLSAQLVSLRFSPSICVRVSVIAVGSRFSLAEFAPLSA